MLYLNDRHIRECQADWLDLVRVIEVAVDALGAKDFSQPIKPYLRYGDPVNRIIAMPAYLGGETDAAGLKWIASFPKNIDKGIPRASSVSILNEAATGRPLAVVEGAYISAVRTASVSGMITKWCLDQRPSTPLTVGMTGFGPIGQTHLDMMAGLYGDRIQVFRVYDPRPIDIAPFRARYDFPIEVVDSWQAAYNDADVFMTCTVSKAPYVDLKPKPGAFLNNTSLRDFRPECRRFVDLMLVDDWDEVCRESTDIHAMHLQGNLQREDTLDMAALAGGNVSIQPDDVVMFNPMGLAVFDIGLANFYHKLAKSKGIGLDLPA